MTSTPKLGFMQLVFGKRCLYNTLKSIKLSLCRLHHTWALCNQYLMTIASSTKTQKSVEVGLCPLHYTWALCSQNL